jgi:flagellar biosynthetic protein FliQ
MTPETVMVIGNQALTTMLLLGMPVLIVILAIGLIIGIFQAATQINEMTLSFIPKLVGMAATLAIAGPWMLKTIINYTQTLFLNIPALLR